MESGDADSLQEFLSNFGKAYKNWVKSGQKVEKTADFGDSRGDGEKKHLGDRARDQYQGIEADIWRLQADGQRR
jgi:hypothetical protein